jgi:myo-inositol-1-phosphate synthase
MTDEHPRTGVWLVGARGSVATTAVLGAAALRAGLAEPVGCVTEQAAFPAGALPAVGELVFGGHDLGGPALPKRAAELAGAGVLPDRLLIPLAAELAAAEAEIRDGYAPTGRQHALSQAEEAQRLTADLLSFRERLGLARVVVVNLAST